MRFLARDPRGAVYVEFLAVIFPLLFLWLGIAQLAFVGIAKLVVEHAAVTACRAAVVVLDDDPKHYAGAPRGELFQGEDERTNPFRSLVARIGLPGIPALGAKRSAGARYAAVRAAAYLPLLAVAPDPRHFAGGPNLERAVRGRARRFAFGFLALPALTAVTFPASPGSESLRSDLRGATEITVRITHLHVCAIPLASRVLCRRWNEAIDRGALGDLFDESPSRDARAREMEHAELDAVGLLASASSARFFPLRAEATLSNQIAPYAYRSESEASSSALMANGARR